MFNTIVLNTVFSGLAQAATLLVYFYLAQALDPAVLGILMIQLSTASILALVLTLQFERLYVRYKIHKLAVFLRFHILVFLLISALLSVPGYFIFGLPAVLVAMGIALSQMATYTISRLGYFKRLWLLKGSQAAVLLASVFAILTMGQTSFLWAAFCASYAVTFLFLLPLLLAPSTVRPRSLFSRKRILACFKVTRMSFASILLVSGTRELPILAAGLAGEPALAGTIGLVARLFSSPIDFIARSTASVVANYVGERKFTVDSMYKLIAIPAMGLGLIPVFLGIITFLPRFAEYPSMILFLLLSYPFVLTRAYIGLLGSALVYYRLLKRDMLCNALILLAGIGIALLFYLELVPFWAVLVATSSVSVLCVPFVFTPLRDRIRDVQTVNHGIS